MIYRITDKIMEMPIDELTSLELVKGGDQGVQGRVYRFNKEECIKVFNEPKSMQTLETFFPFTTAVSDYATLPKSLLTDDDQFIAYVMNYVSGEDLTKLTDDIDYMKFLQSLKKLYEGIKLISEQGFEIIDCHSGNVRYNLEDEKLILLDTDNWRYRPDRSRNIISRGNLIEVDSVMRAYMFGFYNLCYVNVLLGSIKPETDYVDFYASYMDSLRTDKGEKIKTIAESKKFARGSYNGK